jgi:hypothetical protein
MTIFGFVESEIRSALEAEDVTAGRHHSLVDALGATFDGVAVQDGIHGW